MATMMSTGLSNGIRAGSNSDSDSQLTIEMMLEWLAYLNSNREKSQKSAISMEQKQTRIEQMITDETLVEIPNHNSDPVRKIGVEQKETLDPNQKWEVQIHHLEKSSFEVKKSSDELKKAIHEIGERFERMEMMIAQLMEDKPAEKGVHEKDTQDSSGEPRLKDPGKWKGECEVEPDFNSKLFPRDLVSPTSVITNCEPSEFELGFKSINVLPTSVIEQTEEESIGGDWESNESVVIMEYPSSKVTGECLSETNGDGKKQTIRIGMFQKKVLEKKNQNIVPKLQKEKKGHEEVVTSVVEEKQAGQLVATIESGMTLSSGGYFMDVLDDSPRKHFSLILDRGSGLNEIQCLPCYDCFQQNGAFYDPTASASYKNITCKYPRCNLVSSRDSTKPCKSDNQSCHSYYWYGDNSNTTGDFTVETFTFNHTTSGGKSEMYNVENMMFNCGHGNKGLFHGAAGLLGLGGGLLSFSSQLQSLYGHSFSYCLVDRDSDTNVTSKLIFSEDKDLINHKNLKFTFLVSGKEKLVDIFYYVNIKSIQIAREVLNILEETWNISSDGAGGKIIDFGTTFSYFAAPAYEFIKNNIAEKVKGKFPVYRDLLILDPCFKVTGIKNIQLPEFGIVFTDGAIWNMYGTESGGTVSASESASNFGSKYCGPEVPHLGWGWWCTLRELEAATNGSCEENVIGEGGYGIVYRGVLTDGTKVAIKKWLNNRGQAEKEFIVKVVVIGREWHKNLVRLLEYHVECTYKMFVYDVADNGNLEQWIHGDVGDVSRITWEISMNFIFGMAKGWVYLHEGLDTKVVHKGIKSSNSLLDRQWYAKVSDFGLAKLLRSDSNYVTTRVMETFGYVASEYACTGMLNEKNNFYSFGILIMRAKTNMLLISPVSETPHPRGIHELDIESVKVISEWKLEKDVDISMSDITNGGKGEKHLKSHLEDKVSSKRDGIDRFGDGFGLSLTFVNKKGSYTGVNNNRSG